MPEAPPVKATVIDGEVWLHASDLASWAIAGQSEAGGELALKIVRMAAETISKHLEQHHA